MPLEKLKNELPTNGVEGLTDEEKRRALALVESSCKVTHIQKIVVDASLLDEGTLGIGNKLIHKRCKPGGNHFRLTDVLALTCDIYSPKQCS
jgi:hypothetical protein